MLLNKLNILHAFISLFEENLGFCRFVQILSTIYKSTIFEEKKVVAAV